LVRQLSSGDEEVTSQVFRAVYAELRSLAEVHLSKERSDHTLQATALVHEAYLRLVETPQLQCQDRSHFMAIASRVMRNILVDHARKKRRLKRGGGYRHVSLDQAVTIGAEAFDMDLLALDRALGRLQEEQPEKARVVEMRFFGGMRIEEIAEVLDVTARTVRRYWAYAQARLYQELMGNGPN
jgi:RNA polymerase sigma factor (TIGR02999 family)